MSMERVLLQTIKFDFTVSKNFIFLAARILLVFHNQIYFWQIRETWMEIVTAYCKLDVILRQAEPIGVPVKPPALNYSWNRNATCILGNIPW